MGELLKVTLASKPAGSGLLIAGTFVGETPKAVGPRPWP